MQEEKFLFHRCFSNKIMFEYLDIETIGNCNRRCSTCIRNSHPDRDALRPWFSGDLLPKDVIINAVYSAYGWGFRGKICLSHYNEPLMDKRLVDIIKEIKQYFIGSFIYLHTNGDFLTSEVASQLDGRLDRIVVTLYMDEPQKGKRAEQLHGLFSKTICDVITQSAHIPTHFSPAFPVDDLAKKHKDHTCQEPSMRVIINHRSEYLLCCDDVIGNFDLGRFPEVSIAEHWRQKQEIQKKLSVAGGRSWHPYCESCPRP